MKKISAIMILSMALPLCGMDDVRDPADTSRNSYWSRFSGAIFADGVVRRLREGTWNRLPLRRTKNQRASSNSVAASVPRRRTIAMVALLTGAAVLARSEHKAHRAGKQTMLRRLWQKMRRIVRGETREETTS